MGIRSFIGKVEFGKLAVMQFCHFIARASTIFRHVEVAKMDTLPVDRYTGLPFLFARVPGHTDIARGVVFIELLVVTIFFFCAFAQVTKTVIEAVVIVVICFFVSGDPENYSVHLDADMDTIYNFSSCSVEGSILVAFSCAPRPLYKPVVVDGIDDTETTVEQVDFTTWFAVNPNNFWIGNARDERTRSTATFTEYSAVFLLPAARWADSRACAGSRFTCKLIQRLVSLFPQVHVSPPSEMCGQAALGVF